MLYLDASSLVKRYVEEEGSDWDARLHRAARDRDLMTLPAALG